MSNTRELDRAIEAAIARLDAAGTLAALTPRDQTVLIVHGAQGVIDNGGLQYFFESDWPDQPPYEFFSDAYRRIGASAAAARIDKAVALLGVPDPHLVEGRRQERLEELRSDSDWAQLDAALCGHATVWEKLAQYVVAEGLGE